MELLAPAGSDAALTAAVQSGADAVYIGGSRFSARQSAENFSMDDMKRRIDYCHIRGVDVHVAANILIKDKEKNEFLEYVGKINEIGADALIIQDIGMASLVRKYFPDLPLHASTQMTAASLEAVEFLEGNGFSRVVLSRELSEEEILYITKNSKIETEVFAHGALCICYSGQCLMSSIFGGRSGNRGMCAQPCRLFYELFNDKEAVESGYLLSPKDLALIDEVNRLKEVGVASLKIEGRLKRAEYVAAVTNIYRKAMNFTGKITDNDRKELLDAFNRSGFTKGYFKNKTGKEMMSVKTPGNISENKFSSDVISRCRADANERKVEIDIYAKAVLGEAIELTITDKDFNSVTVSGEIKAEAAERRPMTEQRFYEQLIKLGNTPFRVDNIELAVDNNISLPISEINNVRRMAVQAMEAERCKVPFRRSLPIEDKLIKQGVNNGYIFSAQVMTKEQASAVLDYDISVIYAPPELAKKIKKTSSNKIVVTILPPIWRKRDNKDIYISDGVLINNIGQLKAFSDYNCYGGSRLNIFNSDSAEFYKNLKSVEVSYELNINEIKRLAVDVPLEIIIYGRIPLMILGNCPAKAYSDCGKKLFLKDRRNQTFPLDCSIGCYTQILNSKPLYMADKSDELKKLPVSKYKLSFTDESEEECRRILNEYIKSFRGDKNNVSLKENSFTRGHYYRGVE